MGVTDIWMDERYKCDGNRKERQRGVEGNSQRNRCGLRALVEGMGSKGRND